MSKIRIQLVSILVLLSLFLTGCNGWKNYIHTESSLKREAADVLEEKYDEEFVIHKVWIKNQTTFYATCSPKDDSEIVFEAQVYKDGSGIYKDVYIHLYKYKVQFRNRWRKNCSRRWRRFLESVL